MENDVLTKVDSCAFVERFYQRIDTIDQASRGLTATDFDQIDQDLLNRVTSSLNDKIRDAVEIRNDTISKKTIPSEIKTSFRRKYVTNDLFETYNTDVISMSDLFRFTSSNNIFSTRQQVINAVDDLGHSFFISFGAEYPFISERVSLSDISSAETLVLINQIGASPDSFSDTIQRSPTNVFSLLERFLSKLGSSSVSQLSSICSLIESVYSLMSGQIDSLGTLAQLGSDRRFQDMLSRIDPRIQLISGQIGQIQSLITSVLDASQTMEARMKNAFELIAAAQGIAVEFFDRSSRSSSKVKVDWDLGAIKQALEDVVNDVEPNKTLFLKTFSDGSLISDFDFDGSVTMDDVDLFQVYIDYIDAKQQGIDLDEQSTILVNFQGITLDTLIVSVEEILFSYMIENIEQYQSFVNVNNQQYQISESINNFKQVASSFGSADNPSQGDFGQQTLQQMLSIVSSLNNDTRGLLGQLSSISTNLQSGFSMVDVQGPLQSIQQLRQLSRTATEQIFGDQTALLGRFTETVRGALEDAEDVSTTDPERTREISDARTEALREDVADVTSLVGTATTQLSGELLRQLQALSTQLDGAAATGIVEHIEHQMDGRVRAAAQRLSSAASTFDARDLSPDGFTFNTQGVFERMAIILAQAREAGSPRGAERTISAARGVLTVQTDRIPDVRRPQAEFIALRFCNLVNEIDRIFDSFLDPARRLVQQNAAISSSIRATSDQSVRGVIESGGIRLTRDARVTAATAAGTSIPATISRPHRDPVSGSRTIVPPADTLSSGGYGPTPIVPSDYGNLPSFDDLRGNQVWNGLFRFGGGMSRSRNHWDPILELPEGVDMLRRFLNVANTWRSSGGSPLVIISAFRRGARTPGGRVSQHALGKALDIECSGRTNQIRLMNIAYNAGFRGLGSYNIYGGFVHIDTSGGSWGVFRYYSLPGTNGNKIG